MGYRDETETLRARVTKLESDLEDAHEKIGHLTGIKPAPKTRRSEVQSPIIEAPKLVQLERELNLEVSDEGLQAIAELLRERGLRGVARPTSVSQVGHALTAPGFSLAQRDGMTQISMTGDYRAVPLWAVSAGALLGGPIAMTILWIVRDSFVQNLPEAHILWMAPSTMALVFALARSHLSRSVKTRAEKLRGTFEAVVELAKRHRVRSPTRIRVEADAEPAMDAEVLEPAAGATREA